MKYSNTTLRELNAQYRSVLKKCFLFNAAVFVGTVMIVASSAADTIQLGDRHFQTSKLFIANDTEAVLQAGSSVSNNTNLTDGIGGAIYIEKAGGSLVVEENVVFNNNESIYDGGAIGNYGSLTVLNAKFTENKAQTSTMDSQAIGGGAISLGIDSFTTIAGTTFSDNTSGYSGGAIGTRKTLQNPEVADAETRNSLTISNSLFTGNKALGTLTDTSDSSLLASGNGGAIANTFATVSISDTVFSDNSAVNYGGAIFNMPYENAQSTAFYDVGGKMTLSNTNFDNNSAKFGGAIFNQGTLTFENGATFNENKANGGAGGAIYNQGTINALDNMTFSRNSAVQGGAINNAKLTLNGAVGTINSISNSVFSNNSAGTSQGGAIRNQGVIGSIVNTTFDSNTAGNGGAINNGTWGDIDTISSIESARFTNNKASGGNGQGGAITNAGKIGSIKSVIFETNTADTIGGAFANVAPQTSDKTIESSVAFEDVIFTGNSAGENGGAIYNDVRGIVNLSGTNLFTGNTAAGVGNDIHNLGKLNITGGTTKISGGITGTGNLTVAEGATLDIGTASVSQGTATFASGSTLKASLLNSSSYGSLTADTISADGANLFLTVGAAGEYTILTGAGADSFNVATQDVASLFALEKTFNEQTNTLTYIATQKTADQIAADTGISSDAAGVLATVANGSNDTANQIALNMQNHLAEGNTAAVEKAASDLAPTTSSTVHSVATTVHSQILGAVNNRLAAPVVGRSGGDIRAKFGPWAQGLYNRSKQDSSSSTPGFRGYTQGVALGVDAELNDAYTLGIGYAYNATDVKSAGRKTDIYGHNFFIYGEYQPNAWFVNATLNYSTSDYKEHKLVTGVNVDGKYDVDTWGGQFMTGYDTEIGLTPKAGLRYLHIKQDSYTDTSGQRIEADDSDLLTAVIGADYAHAFVENGYSLTPEVRLAATYDVVSDNADAVVSMGTSSYTASGKRLPRFGVEAGVGVTMNIADAMDITLNYDAGIRRDYTSHTGTLKLKYNF